MIELLPEDVHACVRFMPLKLRKLIVDNKLMVAGGYVRAVIAHEEVSDIQEALHPARWADNESIEDKEG